MANKIDKVEFERRIRAIQEWIIEEWPYQDMVTQVVNKYGVTDRQAKRYIKEARTRWVKQDQEQLENRRRLKIETLKKLKRSLNDKWKGTPAGIRAIIAVEKEIIILENIRPATKVQLTGKNDGPIEVNGSITHNVNFKRSDGTAG